VTTTAEPLTLPPAADSTRVLLPYEPQSAAAARRLVRTAMRAWGLDDLVEAGELVVHLPELGYTWVSVFCLRRS
jgi:hypothetical protein